MSLRLGRACKLLFYQLTDGVQQELVAFLDAGGHLPPN